MHDKTTDFGFETINAEKKAGKVSEIFSSVAKKYDLMNDLMSLGVHRLWKRYAVALCQLKPGHKVLDIAGGTGDLSNLIAPKIMPNGHIVLSDINNDMLSIGRDRMLDSGFFNSTNVVQTNAEMLSFANNSFDRIIIGFGLRNVTDKLKALQSMYRCLKPGGHLVVLEFSKPVLPLLDKVYDAYSFSILPWLGKLIANDKQSYQYLVESIRMHPSQEDLKALILEAGFDVCKYQNLSGGIVATHRGTKY